MSKSKNQPPSIEDLKKAREEQSAFMREQIEHLEIREKYTGLKAKIAENIYVESMAKVKLAGLQHKEKSEGELDDKTN